MNTSRILAYTAHYIKLVGKLAVYLTGCIFVKPFLLLSRRSKLYQNSSPVRILYVSLAHRGDFLLSLPAITALKRHLPQSTITCWIRGFNQSLARLSPAIDHVFIYDDFRSSGFATLVELFQPRRHQSFLQNLRSRQFDVMVDDTGIGFTALYGFRAGIPLRIGRNVQGYGFLNHFDFPEDANSQLVEKRLRLLRPLGIRGAEIQTVAGALSIDQQLAQETLGKFSLAGGRYFTVQPNGGWKTKNWPLDRVALVSGQIASETRLTAVLLGSANDWEGLETVGRNSGGQYLNLAGKLELDELAAIIANSTLHLGVDSVGSHLACAVGTRSLTIFGPTNPLISHSFSSRNIAVFKRTRCTPRVDRQYCCLDAGRTCPHNACMHELPADEVLKIALQLLNSEFENPLVEL